jgi:hypothetical protein
MWAARASCTQPEGPVESANIEALRCSLTGRVMVDPVIAADGYSYERQVLIP